MSTNYELKSDKMLNWSWKILFTVAMFYIVALFLFDVLITLLDFPKGTSDETFYTGLISLLSELIIYIFVAVISFKGLRRGQKWAWIILWLFPFGQITAGLIGMFYLGQRYAYQRLIFGILCIIGLFLPYQRFLTKS